MPPPCAWIRSPFVSRNFSPGRKSARPGSWPAGALIQVGVHGLRWRASEQTRHCTSSNQAVASQVFGASDLSAALLPASVSLLWSTSSALRSVHRLDAALNTARHTSNRLLEVSRGAVTGPLRPGLRWRSIPGRLPQLAAPAPGRQGRAATSGRWRSPRA